MQIRAAAAPPRPAPTSLRELYDSRQQELAAGEDRYQKLAARHDSAHEVSKYGMGTLFAGLTSTVASTVTKSSMLMYAGIGLTVAGLAVFCPALWIRDSAGFEASFQRMDNNSLRESQRDLAKELGIQR